LETKAMMTTAVVDFGEIVKRFYHRGGTERYPALGTHWLESDGRIVATDGVAAIILNPGTIPAEPPKAKAVDVEKMTGGRPDYSGALPLGEIPNPVLREIECDECDGFGALELCPECDGTGDHHCDCEHCHENCEHCRGDGWRGSERGQLCNVCNGKGTTEDEDQEESQVHLVWEDQQVWLRTSVLRRLEGIPNVTYKVRNQLAWFFFSEGYAVMVGLIMGTR
jgi:hypothetical protein